MQTIFLILLLAGFIPLGRAWRANRHSALAHALGWAAAGWVMWAWAFWLDASSHDSAVARYVALSVTGCPLVAVLGARRPGVVAWHFVVAGLLVVLLIPIGEHFLSGNAFHVVWFRALLLGCVIVAGSLNYLPTHLAWAAIPLSSGCVLEILNLAGLETMNSRSELVQFGPRLLLVSVPWLGWWSVCGQMPARCEFDRTWIGFRDRFGFLWAQRVREQFNRAAANAGWPLFLSWQELRPTTSVAGGDACTTKELFLSWQKLRPTSSGANIDPAMHDAALVTLRSLLKRFGVDGVPPYFLF